jgi:hypothetical protein
MRAICPKCRAEIAVTDIPASSSIAHCPQCTDWKVSALLEAGYAPLADLAQAPRRAWFKRRTNGFEIGTASGLWKSGGRWLIGYGLVSIFFMTILGAEIIRGEFSFIFNMVALIFIFSTLILGCYRFMGKEVIIVENGKATIFAGMGGPLGRRYNFTWDKITDVRRIKTKDPRGEIRSEICLIREEGGIAFAATVTNERFDFMLGALQQMRVRQN